MQCCNKTISSKFSDTQSNSNMETASTIYFIFIHLLLGMSLEMWVTAALMDVLT